MAIKINGTTVIDDNRVAYLSRLEIGSKPDFLTPGMMAWSSVGKRVVISTGETSNQEYMPPLLGVSGGSVTTSGNLRTHYFNTTAEFFTTVEIANATYEILAGGGGGGGNIGGGGGGGGLRKGIVNITAGTHMVTVGSGGAGDPGLSGDGSNGGNSNFFAIEAAGGGGGGKGQSNGRTAPSGGCGGGGGGGDPGGFNEGGDGNVPFVAYLQGFPGGSGHGYTPHYQGGGGGGGAAGPGEPRGSSWNSSAGPGGRGNYVADVIKGGGGGGGQLYQPGQPTAASGDGGIGGGGNGGGGVQMRESSAGLAGYGGGGGGMGRQANPTVYYYASPGGSGCVAITYTYK